MPLLTDRPTTIASLLKNSFVEVQIRVHREVYTPPAAKGPKAMEVQGKLAEDRRLVPRGQTLAVAEVK